MICSSAGIIEFAAVEPEAFGAGEFDVAELFEAFGFNQLVENGALAFGREADLLVGPFDAFLNPGFLCGVGNVQEFDAQRLAIGAPEDGDDLSDGAEFEAENFVEKNRPVQIGLGEAVSRGVEFDFRRLRLQMQRIEIGVEMPARAIGADQHQRADGVTRRAFDVGDRKLDAGSLRLFLDLAAKRFGNFAPVAVKRRGKLVALWARPVRALPRRSVCVRSDLARVVLEVAEKRLPLGVDRRRIDLVPRVKVVDIRGVSAVKERGPGESSVRILARHEDS